jgi:hypothetical protein
MDARTSPLVDVVELSKLARSELFGFAAAQLAALPVPVRITLAGAITPRGNVIWHTALRPPRSESQADLIFDGEEVRAIALGVQADRVRASELCTFCLRKLQDPGFRVTETVALDGARAESGSPWSLERVLQLLDLDAREVEYQDAETHEVRSPQGEVTSPDPLLGTTPAPRNPAPARDAAVVANPRIQSSPTQAVHAVPRETHAGRRPSRAA